MTAARRGRHRQVPPRARADRRLGTDAPRCSRGRCLSLRRRHHVLAVGGDGQRCGRRRRRRLTGRGGEERSPRLPSRTPMPRTWPRAWRAPSGPPSSPSDRAGIFWAVRTLLHVLADRQPLLILLEDLHSGRVDVDRTGGRPGATLAAPDHGAGGGTPGIAGPTRAPVGGPGRARPPDGSPRRRPGGQLPRTAHVAGDQLERIVAVAQGNPLFLEELLRMLIDEGALRREDGSWGLAPEFREVAIPPTIQGLLGARLDRLEPDQRKVLERASLVGEEFWPAALGTPDARDGAARARHLPGRPRRERPGAAGRHSVRYAARVPLRAHPDARRGLRAAPQGGPRRAPRAACAVGRAARRRACRRIRGDPRVPPRARRAVPG